MYRRDTVYVLRLNRRTVYGRIAVSEIFLVAGDELADYRW